MNLGKHTSRGRLVCEWVKSLNRVRFFSTPWTVAYQATPFIEFYRQEYWSGLPFPSSGDLPDLGIEPRSPALWANALPSAPPGKPTFYSWIMDRCSGPQSLISKHHLGELYKHKFLGTWTYQVRIWGRGSWPGIDTSNIYLNSLFLICVFMNIILSPNLRFLAWK